MKTLGLLGGMSWQSSIEYERTINQIVHDALGGVASADLIMRSFNFQEIEDLQTKGDWQTAGQLLAEAAKNLQDSGAQGVVICTNTMHKVADQIQAAISIPLIHIADVTGSAIQTQGLKTVALLGTNFTMSEGFYRDRLLENFGISAIVPNESDRGEIHRIIYQELVQGKIISESREFVLRVIETLMESGVEGIIAGCTEIELLVKPSDVDVPYFPTSYLHAKAAAEFALGK
jgi:aspartate racemase